MREVVKRDTFWEGAHAYLISRSPPQGCDLNMKLAWVSSPLSNPSKLAFSCKIWRESVGNYWSKNKQVTCDLNIDKLGARLSFFSIPLIRVDIFFFIRAIGAG